MEREINDYSPLSKLEMLHDLIQQGWADGPLATPLTADGPRFYVLRNLGRSKHYWMALMQSRSILSKVPQIHNNKPQAYYQCLIELPAAKLARLLALADFPRWRQIDFRRYLQGGPLEMVPSPLPLSDGHIEGEDVPAFAIMCGLFARILVHRKTPCA